MIESICTPRIEISQDPSPTFLFPPALYIYAKRQLKNNHLKNYEPQLLLY